MLLDFRLCSTLLCLGLLVGCANESAGPQATDSSSVEMSGEHGEQAPLSAEDQALADAQKICPVGGGELGSMGVPYKVMVEDRAVFLCCEHCKDALLADPDKYLAKLDAAAAQPAEEAKPAAEESATEAPAAEGEKAPAAEAAPAPISS